MPTVSVVDPCCKARATRTKAREAPNIETALQGLPQSGQPCSHECSIFDRWASPAMPRTLVEKRKANYEEDCLRFVKPRVQEPSSFMFCPFHVTLKIH